MSERKREKGSVLPLPHELTSNFHPAARHVLFRRRRLQLRIRTSFLLRIVLLLRSSQSRYLHSRFKGRGSAYLCGSTSFPSPLLLLFLHRPQRSSFLHRHSRARQQTPTNLSSHRGSSSQRREVLQSNDDDGDRGRLPETLLDLLKNPLQPDPLNEEILEAGRGTLSWSVELRRHLPRLPLEIHRRIAELGPDYPDPVVIWGGVTARTKKKHLITAALVCRDWKDFAIPLLYASVDLDPMERYGKPAGDGSSAFARSLHQSGLGTFVTQINATRRIGTQAEGDLLTSFFYECGNLPHLIAISELVYPFYGFINLHGLAPSLRRIQIRLLDVLPPFHHSTLLLPPTLETLVLRGANGRMALSLLNHLWTWCERLPNISTLEISDFFYNPLHPLSSSTLGPFNSLGSRITRLILNRVFINSSFFTSLSKTYPSLRTLGLSFPNTKLPSDPSDAILSHPLLKTLEIDDPDGRGIDEIIEWLKFLYRPSKNLLKVPKLGRIKIVANFVWEFEPDIRSEGKTFDVLKGLWDMWVEVADSRGSVWDEEWAEELERDT